MNGSSVTRPPRPLPLRLLAAGCFALAIATPAWSARTRTFSTDTYEAFRKGEQSGVTLTDDGRIHVGPAETLLADPGVQNLWALASDGRGGIVMATGGGGVVSARGPGEKEEVRTLATLFDSEVFALTDDGRGTVYAAGAPVSTVTRIDSRGGVRPLFDVPEGVVFALLAGSDGSVYAATGDRGRLYRITAEGEGKVVYESPDLSLRSLALAPNGRIWAGTDPRGLVLEIDPSSGRGRVWYDASEDEIVALLPEAGGGLVFAANPRLGPGGGGSEASEGGRSGGEPKRNDRLPDEGGARPAVYRMSADGSVQRLWSSPESLIHALALSEEGDVWVATSERAAVFRITRGGRQSLVWRPRESQVLSLRANDGGLWAGTGGPGRLYRLGPAGATEATFTGSPLDAGDQSRWGVLRWLAVGGDDGLAFETRSGYTETPDDTWSDWMAVETAGPDRRVASPPGRFLQWRVRFAGERAEQIQLERVDVAAAAANRAPRINALRISPDEPVFTSPDQARGGVTQTLPGGFQIDYSLPAEGGVTVTADEVPPWVRRLRSVVWDAQDPDGDELGFTLEIRGVGDSDWRVLAEDRLDRGWTLDQTQLPDGLYEIRLTATDAPGNPEPLALRDERITPPFRVDTVAPTLSEVRLSRSGDGKLEVSGVAADESTPLRRIEASLDGERYRWLLPDDGMMDSRLERFSGRLAMPEDGVPQWIVVRAQDAAGNRGLHRAWLEP